MTNEDQRRSERIAIELPIEVSGTDASGRMFLTQGKTTVITRFGAKILLPRSLVPDQEINLRCLETGREATARVVGQIGQGPEGSYYGIGIVEEDANPWAIEFPPLSEASQAAGRVLIECGSCHTREAAYLDEFELEVLEANDFLPRYCKRCADSSVWRKSPGTSASESAEKSKAIPLPEQRRETRREMRIQACVKSVEFGEEVVVTRNVSRSGLCFASHRPYKKDWEIEVAIPYSKGGANIFMVARIARVQKLQTEGVNLYGAFYHSGPEKRP